MFFNRLNNKNSVANSKSANRAKINLTQVVCSTRWIHRNELEVGMYVNELDVPWEKTRFMFQGFYIDNNELLFQVQDACEYVSVQTEKLAKISRKQPCQVVSAKSAHRQGGKMLNC